MNAINIQWNSAWNKWINGRDQWNLLRLFTRHPFMDMMYLTYAYICSQSTSKKWWYRTSSTHLKIKLGPPNSIWYFIIVFHSSMKQKNWAFSPDQWIFFANNNIQQNTAISHKFTPKNTSMEFELHLILINFAPINLKDAVLF